MSGCGPRGGPRSGARSLRCFLILILVFELALPQLAAAAAWQIRDLTAGSELATDSFNTVLPLADGHLLLTSFYAPPVLFDGRDFRRLAFHGEAASLLIGASSALELDNRDLWFGTRQRGLLRVDSNAHIERVPLDAADTVLDVRALLRSRGGELLVGTSQGVFAVADPATPGPIRAPTPQESELAVTALFEDRSGSLWIGTERGLYRRSAGSLERIDEPRLDTYIWSILQDRHGVMWVATRGAGLGRLEQQQWRFFDTQSGFPHGVVRHIAEAPDGSLWVATAGGGLVQLRGETVITRLDSTDGLPGDSFYWLHSEADGSLWSVGPGIGVQRIQRSAFDRWLKSDGLASAFVWTVYEDRDGVLWVGGNTGVTRREGDAIEVIGAPGPGYQSVVRCFLRRRDGRFLAGTDGGLFLFDGKRFSLVDGTAGATILAMAEDAAGNLWAAGSVLLRFDAQGSMQSIPPGHEDGWRIVHLRHAEDGTLELIDTRRGLLQLAEGEPKLIASIADIPGLRGQWTDPDGRRWLLGESMAWLDAQHKVHTLEQFATLHARGLHAGLADGVGGVWITGNGGLFRFDVDALRQHAAGLAPEPMPLRFDRSDGLSSTEFNGGNQNAAMQARDGSLWLASTNGLTRVDPRMALPAARSASLRILTLEANEQSLPAAQATRLPAGTRRVGVRYTALPAAVGGDARFAYRLLPVVSDWIDTGESRQALFPSLAPGAYRFELRAHLPGSAAMADAALDFSIAPSFWERRDVIWLTGLLLLLIAAALPTGHILGLRRQRRRLLDEVAEKTRRLQQLTITDPLTGLANRRAFDAALLEYLGMDATGLLLIDIDHFKRFNDSAGHAAGDACLQRVAQALGSAVRHERDLLARIGGEEFAVLVASATPELLHALGERVHARLSAAAIPHPDSPDSAIVTASSGAAIARGAGQGTQLFDAADAALYEAKRQGRNRLVMAPSSADRLRK